MFPPFLVSFPLRFPASFPLPFSPASSPTHLPGTFIIGGTDEIQTILDDQIVKIQAMNASPFVKAFKDRAATWEQTLQTLQVRGGSPDRASLSSHLSLAFSLCPPSAPAFSLF